MKERKHQSSTFETALEQVEQMIEHMDANKPIQISDITKRFRTANINGDITRAITMLLQKYGITYLED